MGKTKWILHVNSMPKFWNYSEHKFSNATKVMNRLILISVYNLGMYYVSSVEPGLRTMEPLKLIIGQMRDFLKVTSQKTLT